ncbi:hypothetical protein FNV43_RR00518 [Rhamnella rubrinervis]|uniref:Uncharacterized protein n=1 Tax=Rhamnella rubrinervis TaxID=2594499 RepID=A0A8K0HNR9_9ROSA|nr:hypothetical protein FNV43_RR00518 [Rhamnella rubrinervis]
MASERRQTLSSMVVMPDQQEEEVTPIPGHIVGPSTAGSGAIDNDNRFEQLLAQMEDAKEKICPDKGVVPWERTRRKVKRETHAVGRTSITEERTGLVPEEIQGITNQVGNLIPQTNAP